MDMNMKRMMADIESEVHYTRSMIGRDALDPRVMQVMAKVPRDKFVPPEMKAAAFDNGPLPIGHGQTISQPYIVALMTDLLKPEPGDRVLVVGDNFGCGSSREHAVWALLDYGFRVVIAPSFADIFFNNCFKNGVLPIVLEAARLNDLFEDVEANPGYRLRVNLEQQTITRPDGGVLDFEIDEFRKYCLLNGLDDIGLTLQHADDIRAYEARRKQEAPWLFM